MTTGLQNAFWRMPALALNETNDILQHNNMPNRIRHLNQKQLKINLITLSFFI
jgi:hypothetical protein